MPFANKQKRMIEGTSLLQDEQHLGKISAESVALFKGYSNKWTYQQGQAIFECGDYIDYLLYIDQGTVVYELISNTGEKRIVSYVNQFLSAESFFSKQPILYYATAVETTVIYALPQQYVNEILLQADIRDFLLCSLSFRCRILGWQVNDLSFGSVREKICRLLCCYTVAVEDGSHYLVTLTHQNLAFLTGAHRVTITNTLNQLRQEGLIDMKSGNIILKNREEMIKIGFYGIFQDE